MTQLEHEKALIVGEIEAIFIDSDESKLQSSPIEIEVNDDLSVSILRDSNGAMVKFLGWYTKHIRNIKFYAEKD